MLLWLKSSPALQQIFAYDWHLAFAVMLNITNMFLQSLITDIALTLIFCHLYPLQATIQISRALACHTAKAVNNFQIYQLAGRRLLIKYCCTVGNIAKNTDVLHSWPLDKLNTSTRLLWLWPFFPWETATPRLHYGHCSWLYPQQHPIYRR